MCTKEKKQKSRKKCITNVPDILKSKAQNKTIFSAYFPKATTQLYTIFKEIYSSFCNFKQTFSVSFIIKNVGYSVLYDLVFAATFGFQHLSVGHGINFQSICCKIKKL